MTSGRPQTSASTVPAHNLMWEAPALRHAALAWSSSAGCALIGPGGSISFAAGTVVDVGDFPESEVEVWWLIDLGDPGLHPATTSDTETRTALTRRERDVARLLLPG